MDVSSHIRYCLHGSGRLFDNGLLALIRELGQLYYTDVITRTRKRFKALLGRKKEGSVDNTGKEPMYDNVCAASGGLIGVWSW